MKDPKGLTWKDVECLRKKPPTVEPGNEGVKYMFTDQQVEEMREQLMTLYPDGKVQRSFAAKILLLNELDG